VFFVGSHKFYLFVLYCRWVKFLRAKLMLMMMMMLEPVVSEIVTFYQ